MPLLRIRAAALALAGGLALGACAYDDYGYGYGGFSAGYGGYHDPYDDYYYADPYWGQFRSRPYWGWHGGYYYPGTGIYIYDSYRRPHRWSDRHRRHWLERRHFWRDRDRWRGGWRDNWRDFRCRRC